MELRIVSRTRVSELSFPFSEHTNRHKGVGFLKLDEESGRFFIAQHTKQGDAFVNACDCAFSELIEGKFMKFLTIGDQDTSVHKTFVWSEDEYLGFVVNDNGKTVDKI